MILLSHIPCPFGFMAISVCLCDHHEIISDYIIVLWYAVFPVPMRPHYFYPMPRRRVKRQASNLPIDENEAAIQLRQSIPGYRGDFRSLIRFFQDDAICRWLVFMYLRTLSHSTQFYNAWYGDFQDRVYLQSRRVFFLPENEGDIVVRTIPISGSDSSTLSQLLKYPAFFVNKPSDGIKILYVGGQNECRALT